MLYHYLKYARNTFEMISSSFLHVFNRYQQGGCELVIIFFCIKKSNCKTDGFGTEVKIKRE